MPVVARITAKGQTTVPRQIREALQLRPGDMIVWEAGPEGVATVRRVQPLDVEYLRAVDATLSEWTSPADEEAYRDL